jgi:hypothetical protein
LISCSQADLDLAVRIMQSGRMRRLSEVAESYQGEINETNDRKRRLISYDESDGPEVIRGAHLCLYALREASQGRGVYLLRDKYIAERRTGKGLHHQYARVGFQRKSPQNNFRRLIAASIPAGTFLLESISYIPAHRCVAPLAQVLAVLNSKLADWYFRLGSTNAMVAEYQVNNLPFPRFADSSAMTVGGLVPRVLEALARPEGGVETGWELVAPLTGEAPFDPVLGDVICALVQRIEEIEAGRGEIARSARSALTSEAQPHQEFIDRLLFALAGLSELDRQGLEDRLTRML